MDSFEEWLEKLQDDARLVVVEGRKDKEALERLGVQRVVTVAQKPLYRVVESMMNEKEVIILTDFDAEGKRWYGRLFRSLQRVGVKVDNSYRLFLMRETRLSHVEGLARYAARRTR